MLPESDPASRLSLREIIRNTRCELRYLNGLLRTCFWLNAKESPKSKTGWVDFVRGFSDWPLLASASTSCDKTSILDAAWQQAP